MAHRRQGAVVSPGGCGGRVREGHRRAPRPSRERGTAPRRCRCDYFALSRSCGRGVYCWCGEQRGRGRPVSKACAAACQVSAHVRARRHRAWARAHHAAAQAHARHGAQGRARPSSNPLGRHRWACRRRGGRRRWLATAATDRAFAALRGRKPVSLRGRAPVVPVRVVEDGGRLPQPPAVSASVPGFCTPPWRRLSSAAKQPQRDTLGTGVSGKQRFRWLPGAGSQAERTPRQPQRV